MCDSFFNNASFSAVQYYIVDSIWIFVSMPSSRHRRPDEVQKNFKGIWKVKLDDKGEKYNKIDI